jgi:hypothetical protein
MLAINPQVKIYLHADPIDMRKSFDGLFGIIKSDLHLDTWQYELTLPQET